MVELQLLTGMRPGEACALRTGDIDRSGKVWIYKPPVHKTAYRGQVKEIRLGPKAQDLLTPMLKLDPTAFIFSPAESEQLRRAAQRAARKSKVQPSQIEKARASRRRRRGRAPADRYTKDSYNRAIARACDQTFPAPTPLAQRDDESAEQWMERLTEKQRKELATWQSAHRWSPNQLRHSVGTRLRKEYGIEAARVVLGHRSSAVTEIYAEIDASKAEQIMLAVG